MTTFINIKDRENLRHRLQQLKTGAIPLWGKMKPQQMVEHLITQVRFTNGTYFPSLDVSPEEAAQLKAVMLYTDKELPRNVVLDALPDNYEFNNLQTAINQLFIELDTFEVYFRQNGREVIHGSFGPMNYHEWMNWHGKHFTHHLKQFGLILS